MPARAGRRFGPAVILGLALGLASTACSGGSPPAAPAGASSSAPAVSSAAAGPVVLARWTPFRHVRAVVDLTQPRQDGRLTVAAAGRLALLGGAGQAVPFAQGNGGYSTTPGTEPYIALASGAAVAGASCAFTRDTVYALEPGKQRGVIAVNPQGQAGQVVSLPGVSPTGIVFDDTGRFGHRLLVTQYHERFTRYRKEHGPSGSPLPSGGDIGVESAAFVPADFTRDWGAYLADRVSPGNPHPGTDSVLALSGADLLIAGVAPGDLLVASEGGAQTVAVRCAATCTLRHVADGPAPSHAEGHIVIAPALQ